MMVPTRPRSEASGDRQKAGDADQPGIFEDAQDFFHDAP
jgi:hypothetical protein